MTLTAPIPVHDMRTAILSGLRTIAAYVHVPEDAIHGRSYAARRELERASRTAAAAIGKNLEPAGLNPDDGVTVFALREHPQDGWILTATWRPL